VCVRARARVCVCVFVYETEKERERGRDGKKRECVRARGRENERERVIQLNVTWLLHVRPDAFTRDVTESSVTYKFICDINDSYVTRLIHLWHDWSICDMTYSYEALLIHLLHDSLIWHDSSTFVTWHDGSMFALWHDSWIYVTWLINVCDMTYSYEAWLIYMWHDSFICDMTHLYVTWLIYMWHDSFICDITHLYVTWLIYMWHDSFICHLYVTWLIYMWRASPWHGAHAPRTRSLFMQRKLALSHSRILSIFSSPSFLTQTHRSVGKAHKIPCCPQVRDRVIQSFLYWSLLLYIGLFWRIYCTTATRSGQDAREPLLSPGTRKSYSNWGARQTDITERR